MMKRKLGRSDDLASRRRDAFQRPSLPVRCICTRLLPATGGARTAGPCRAVSTGKFASFREAISAKNTALVAALGVMDNKGRPRLGGLLRSAQVAWRGAD